jgi:spermidine/putrescine transport system ATP-binding protein
LFTGPVVSSSASSIVVDIAGRKLEIPRQRSQRHAGEVTVGVRPEKLLLHTSAPEPQHDINIVGPGRVTDVSFSGVSTQYQVEVRGLGTIVVFAQNMVFGPVAHLGSEVWLSWNTDHGFGLADDPAETPRFDADTSTRSLAVQRREKLEAELEGA